MFAQSIGSTVLVRLGDQVVDTDPVESGPRDNRSSERGPNDRLVGPTVSRLLLGARLRRAREAHGIPREEAGKCIRASQSKISRLECGRTGFKPRDVADLLTLYQVTDDAERVTLLELARQANTPGWWQPYGELIPTWFETFLGLEQAASLIRSYEVQFVPGLLQTPEYARAVITAGDEDIPDSCIERRVELRILRQRILRQSNPPQLWAVIDEAALRRPIGGPATMRAQLQHLIEVAALPHVTVQVIPFHVGGHAAGGPIAILRFAEPELPDVVFLEQLISAIYPTKQDDIDHYNQVMGRLGFAAEPPATTTAILRRIQADFRNKE
jgi:transcriptional regulator with XRE-family HTH domain